MIRPDFMKQFSEDDLLTDKDKRDAKIKATAINKLLTLSTEEFLNQISRVWDSIGEAAVKICIQGMLVGDIETELQEALLTLSFRCHALTKLISMVKNDADGVETFNLSPEALKEVVDECHKLARDRKKW